MLPVGLKKDLASVLDKGFVVKRSTFDSQYLEIYTTEEWERKLGIVTKNVNPFNPKEVAFLRAYSAGVRKVELDSAGRFLVPKELMKVAGLSKDIVLAGTGLVMELWDKERYEEVIAQQDIGQLAQDLFGEKNIFDELS